VRDIFGAYSGTPLASRLGGDGPSMRVNHDVRDGGKIVIKGAQNRRVI
jgi:hypothetical protein